jgi:hypothetical protein
MDYTEVEPQLYNAALLQSYTPQNLGVKPPLEITQKKWIV